jgi:hypothetical protein
MMGKQTYGQKHVPDRLMSVNDVLIDAVLEIGRERAKILLAMREALLSGDEDEALERARELTGLPRKRPAENGSQAEM